MLINVLPFKIDWSARRGDVVKSRLQNERRECRMLRLEVSRMSKVQSQRNRDDVYHLYNTNLKRITNSEVIHPKK